MRKLALLASALATVAGALARTRDRADADPEPQTDGGRDQADEVCEGLRRISERAADAPAAPDRRGIRVAQHGRDGDRVVVYDETEPTAWINADADALVDPERLRTGWGGGRV